MSQFEDRPKKESRRVAYTKKLIKESLLALLEDSQLTEISITALCTRAGVNRATFYRYYSLPADVLSDIQQELLKSSGEIDTEPKSAEEAKLYLIKLFTFIKDNSKVILILIRSNTDAELVGLMEDVFYKILESKMPEYDDRVADSGFLKLIASYLAGGSYHMVRTWLTEDIRKSPYEMAELAYMYFTRNAQNN